MSVLIKNGFVVSENRICDVLSVEKGICFGSFDTADCVINAAGKHVFGGFVDMHCHLRDPGFTYKEDILSGSRSAAAGGFTTVCAMPNTKPPVDSPEIIEYIKNHEAACSVLPVACITKGMKGEELTDFARLLKAGAIAFSDDGMPVASAGVMRSAILSAKKTGARLLLHEEDLSLRGSGVVNAGENAQKAGLSGIPASTEEVTLARDLILSAETLCPIHICHISTAGSVKMLRAAKAAGVSVTCETQPHYIALEDSAVLSGNTNFKVNPPLRSESDRLEILRGIADGTIDAIATDHAPHSAEEKARAFESAPFGMTGFETAFSVCYESLVKSGIITLKRLNELLSVNPKRLLAVEDFGLCVCDLEKSYVYDEKRIVSKSKNSPFLGKTLLGEVTATIRKGRAIYDRYTDR